MYKQNLSSSSKCPGPLLAVPHPSVSSDAATSVYKPLWPAPPLLLVQTPTPMHTPMHTRGTHSGPSSSQLLLWAHAGTHAPSSSPATSAHCLAHCDLHKHTQTLYTCTCSTQWHRGLVGPCGAWSLL